MAQNELNRLFPNKVNLGDISKSLKSVGDKNLSKRLGLPATLGVGALAGFEGVQDVKRYLKSLGDYGGKSLRTTGNKLDKDEARRIIKDFNSLYFDSGKDRGATAPFIRAITEMGGGVKYPQDTIDTVEFEETQPKVKQRGPVQANINQYQFDPATGLPVLPGEAIGLDTQGGGLTQPPPQIQAIGNPQQTSQQQAKQPGRTVEDIIALAQAQQQLRNEQMAPYMEALQEAMEKYGTNRENNFKRDLSLASLSGMTKNPAYASMIGRYDENQPLEKRLALQQQLAGLKQQQLFDPTPIYGNAELVQRMGLAPEAALANPDFLKQYANIYNYGLDYNAVLARLKQQEQQNALDRQLKWNIHMNPQYNTLASQAQLGSSILSNMQFSPALRESMTPEMIQYLISLTGYNPGSMPVPVQKSGQKPSEDDIIDYNASLRGR